MCVCMLRGRRLSFTYVIFSYYNFKLDLLNHKSLKKRRIVKAIDQPS